jgi:hypothetical protein
VTDALTPLILDFLEWIAAEPKPYTAVMDAWRTSCPKLTVWQEPLVELTPLGREFLERSGRVRTPARTP